MFSSLKMVKKGAFSLRKIETFKNGTLCLFVSRKIKIILQNFDIRFIKADKKLCTPKNKFRKNGTLNKKNLDHQKSLIFSKTISWANTNERK